MQLNKPEYKVQLCENVQTISTFLDEGFLISHALAHTLGFDETVKDMPGPIFELMMAQIATGVVERIDDELKQDDISAAGWEFYGVRHFFAGDKKDLTLNSVSYIEDSPLFTNVITFLMLPDEVDAFLSERFGDPTIKEA